MLKAKKIIFVSLIILVLMIAVFVYRNYFNRNQTVTTSLLGLSSPAFESGEIIPSIYTCRGTGSNPPLVIDRVPTETVSLVLIVVDKDSQPKDFTHWLIWNIDPKTREIGEEPLGEIGENSVGDNGYFAPCPPTGTHRYYFKLYALDKKIELANTGRREELEEVMAGHIIGQTELVGVVKADSEY